MEVSGKNVIITGVSKGIGKAIVEALLEKGSNVAGWGRNKPADIDSPNFHFIEVDIRDPRLVESAYSKTTDIMGDEVQVLINNAGLGHFKIMEDQTVEEWQEMFDTNVHGLFYCTKSVIPGMKAKRYGHIINISSVAGLMGLNEATGYCGTKFAVKGISEAMFRELRRFNIKVSCIYPGSVNTEFFDNYPGITANDTMMKTEEIASTVIHVLENPDNFITMHVEVRPMNASS
ncbi:MAG: SDR family oxidoreductase [Bacteroidetes bacterium]|nr:SDR family oxidoreductase [Bacteroidota bacterium]